MPSGASSKSHSKGSLRLSLGLASKALVDVINKEDKSAKKAAADTSSKTSSAVGSLRRSSNAHSKSMSVSAVSSIRKPPTPDGGKTVTATRRPRTSMQQTGGEVDEMGQTIQPSESSGSSAKEQHQPIIASTRASTLRPRSSGTGSALPKYRPRSIIVSDSTKEAITKPPPSPVRNSKRRSNSSSEDDASLANPSTPTDSSTTEKSSRPISPLPQRRTTRSNTTLPAPTKITKPSTSSITSPSTPKGGGSPVRRSKAVKTSSTSSASQNSPVPRPSSSASSSSTAAANRTPKSPSKTSSLAKTLAREKNNGSPSPMRTAPTSASSIRTSKSKQQQTQTQITIVPAVFIADMSQINEEEDSEEDDVADMLAPIADLTAPTPAIPRLRQKQKVRGSKLNPQTPTRPSNVLPSRSQLSYVSPLPPDKDNASVSSLRPTLKGADGKIARGSILTWEELADASRTLGEDEIGTLLSDIPAPFVPGQHGGGGFPSPTPSINMSLVPESPCLSAMSSPGGYGSISQVLLPEFTPSPAVHASLPRFDMGEAQGQAADSATITLLRLQLASVENTAKERLNRLQDLEEEVHNLKSQRQKQTVELEKASEQMSFLEDTMVSQMRDRAEKDGAYAQSLERDMREMEEGHQRALTDAVAQTRRDVEKYYTSQTTSARKNSAAQKACSGWECARSLAQQELDDMKGAAELVGFLRGELEVMSRELDLT